MLVNPESDRISSKCEEVYRDRGAVGRGVWTNRLAGFTNRSAGFINSCCGSGGGRDGGDRCTGAGGGTFWVVGI